MKIAFPTTSANGLDATIYEHFGRARTFVIVDTKSNEVQNVDNTSEHFGGKQAPPFFLKGLGVTTLICKGLGRKAIVYFEQIGIDVYLTQNNSVKDALSAYKEDKLTLATERDSCKEGRHH
ncbi:MAG: dinitrogenase iron-molybdenum cofactor biosynthesis protein [Candidatus Heimdallarchaeota archaeon]|nr:dinitrogenase iron-molybdenum cofactor biosynthesis protein [Candidatus Heimdallarchaeota archaeon]